jgi:hypothetical protein
VVLAAFALISPFTGALMHNAITLYVVTNSGKLIFYEPEKRTEVRGQKSEVKGQRSEDRG